MNLCYEHRLNAQLEGISHCLKTSLASASDSLWEYTDSGLIPGSSDYYSDYLISPDQCLTLSLNSGTWLKVAPLAPGGLVCENLLIQSDCKSFSALQHFITDSGFAARPACAMTSEQFHSRFRPDSQGHALQSDKATHRLLIMMPDATECNRDNSLIKKICTLLGTLTTAPGQTSIECIHKDTFGAIKSRELLTLLKTRIPGFTRLGMTAMNPDRQTMLAALMGNASLALCGNSGSLADAFQFDLPVALWNHAGTLDTDSINRYCVEWLRHGCRTSKSMIARQQQESWLRVHANNRSAIAVANKSRQLHCTIEKWLNHNNPGKAQRITLQGPQTGRSGIQIRIPGLDLVLPSAFSPTATPSRLQQLRTSLERKHRKFVKFRQSPTRFIEDSEVRWLRALRHPRS